MAKSNPTSSLQVLAHCAGCKQESLVPSSAIGRRHRRHKSKHLSLEAVRASKWVAGPAPKKEASDVQVQ
jgi:hypothetical protein